MKLVSFRDLCPVAYQGRGAANCRQSSCFPFVRLPHAMENAARAGRTVPHFGRQVTHPGVDDETHTVGPICSAGARAVESSSQPLPRIQEL